MKALRALHRPLVILADINELSAFWYFSWLNVFHASYPSHAEGLVLLRVPQC